MEKSSKCSKLLPYHIIAAAASGDVEAINEVLKHYEGYIAALSTRNIFGINCQAKIKKTTIVPVLIKKTRDCHFRHYRN